MNEPFQNSIEYDDNNFGQFPVEPPFLQHYGNATTTPHHHAASFYPTATMAPQFVEILPLQNTVTTNPTAAAMAPYSCSSQKPQRGGRRPREEIDLTTLTEEERYKRDKRLQQNKEAAARSRKKKNDEHNALRGCIQSCVKSMESLISSPSPIDKNILIQHVEAMNQLLREIPPSSTLQRTKSHQQQQQSIALTEDDRLKLEKNKEAAARCRKKKIEEHNALRACIENTVQFLQRIVSHPSPIDKNVLMQHVEVINQKLREIPPSSTSQQTNSHQQQQQILQKQHNYDTSNNNSTALLPRALQFSSSKREFKNDGCDLQYPQHQQKVQHQQRFPRPNTAPINGLNLKGNSPISPSTSDESLFDSSYAKMDISSPSENLSLQAWELTSSFAIPSNGKSQGYNLFSP